MKSPLQLTCLPLSCLRPDLVPSEPRDELVVEGRAAGSPEQFAVFRQLSDPTTLARSLVQLQYITDVAANMPADTHTTASGIFRLAWRGTRTSHATAMRLRTVYMYLPQPVAACLRAPPDTTPVPTIVPAVLLPEDARSAI